ncbi:MAG: hypothetical protein IPK50_12090 [Fibrobacterota bacterium]|nr:hypothetical protein [Fibrobacterota bacterium]QQS03053.1 MAG: hypothetical protein IPK50_12090 [Fibrobacterota bacterium]
MFVSAFALLAGCKDGTNTRGAFPKDSVPSDASIQKDEPTIPRPPPKEFYLQEPFYLEALEKKNTHTRLSSRPRGEERFLFCMTNWIPNTSQVPPRIYFAYTIDRKEKSIAESDTSCPTDDFEIQREFCYFSPDCYASVAVSDLDNSNNFRLSNLSQFSSPRIDYLSRITEKTADFRVPAWEGDYFALAPIDKNYHSRENPIYALPSLENLHARFHAWILLPDRALGPIELRIGSDSSTVLQTIDEQNRSAAPRDILPPMFQKDQRNWVEQRENLHNIKPGIHLDMVRTKGGTKLVLKYRLPWLPQDQVKLQLDPIILQGMDIPPGIKEIGLAYPTSRGTFFDRIAVPAHPLGDGTCAASLLVDPKPMLHDLDVRVYSVFAVTNGQLAGPLMAERNDVHWLQPGLPKAKLRTKAWDPSEETDSASSP